VLLHDAKGNKGFPKIIKLEDNNFAVAQDYSHSNIFAVMNITGCMEVVQVLEGADSVLTAKIIPLPIYLVPLFINGGKPLTVIAALQVFMENFYKTAPVAIKAWAHYILNFLWSATGCAGSSDQDGPVSQLAINMEEIKPDPIMLTWAIMPFSSIHQIAD